MLKSQKLKCCLRGDQEKSRAAQVPVVAGNLLDENVQVKHIYWYEHPISGSVPQMSCFLSAQCFISSYS